VSLQTMSIRLLLVGLIFAGSTFAQAPNDVTNLIYYERWTFLGLGDDKSTGAFGYVLQPDHRAHSLFYSAATQLGPAPAYANYPSPDLTWTYEKIDDQTGALTITADAANPLSDRKTLHFDASDHGTAKYRLMVSASFWLVTPATRAPLANCSNRSFVAAGRSAFSGFVITGDRPRVVLIRAAGPALSAFNISDALPNPILTLTQPDGRVIGQNDDWGRSGPDSVEQTGAFVGAFPLAAGSKDAALVIMLAPGNYIAQVSSAVAGDSGQVLIETYILP
jgi:hypothetical protein